MREAAERDMIPLYFISDEWQEIKGIELLTGYLTAYLDERGPIRDIFVRYIYM